MDLQYYYNKPPSQAANIMRTRVKATAADRNSIYIAVTVTIKCNGEVLSTDFQVNFLTLFYLGKYTPCLTFIQLYAWAVKSLSQIHMNKKVYAN